MVVGCEAAFEYVEGGLAYYFTPIVDFRWSAAYLLRAAANVLRRLHLETADVAAALRLGLV